MKRMSHETKQPRKKRKAMYNAPLHVKRKYASVHLSKELRLKYKARSLQPKKGDKVKIMRGNFKGRSGKIVEVDLVKTKLYIEGINKKRQGGKEKFFAIHPSNCMITEYQEPKLKAKKSKAGKVTTQAKQQTSKPVAPKQAAPAATASAAAVKA